MRKRYQIRLVGSKPDPRLCPDDLAERRTHHELLDGQPADRDHELWLKDLKLALEPSGAVRDFLAGGHSISAAGLFPRETATHGRHVDRGPERRLVQSAALFEPSKERPSGRPGKRPSQRRFLVSGRLPHEQDLAHHRSPADRRPLHLRAHGTASERADVNPEPGVRRCKCRGFRAHRGEPQSR